MALELLAVGFRNAEHVGHHEHGERLGVLGEDLGVPGPDRVGELAGGELPHEALVFPHALGSEQAHHQ